MDIGSEGGLQEHCDTGHKNDTFLKNTMLYTHYSVKCSYFEDEHDKENQLMCREPTDGGRGLWRQIYGSTRGTGLTSFTGLKQQYASDHPCTGLTQIINCKRKSL